MDFRLLLALASSLVAAALPGAATAATYYVRASGSDAADGRSPASAFATIRKAAAAVLNPGDRVVVGPGTYSEGDIGPAHNGIPNRPVVFFADRSGAETGDQPGPVVVTPMAPYTTGFLFLGKRGVTIDGFTIRGATDACVQVRTSADGTTASTAITLRNLEVSNCTRRGIDVTAVGSVTVEDSVSFGNTTGISILGPGGAGPRQDASLGAPEILARGNTVRSNTAAGIFLERVVGGLVADNLAHDNGTVGIDVRSSSGLSVLRNDVRRNREGGIVAGKGVGDRAVGDVEVSANVVTENLGPAIEIIAAGTVVAAANTVPAAPSSAVVVRGNGTAVATIRDNDLAASAIDAVFVESVADALIERNDIDNSGENGIQVRSSLSASIRDNEVMQAGSNGIDVEGDGVVAIENNRVISVGVQRSAPAIAVESLLGSAMITILGNEISGASSHGVSVAGAVAGSVSSNDIDGVGGHGILLDRSAGISLRDNDIAGVVFAGIRGRESADLVAIGNVVANPPDGGINFEADGTVELRENRVFGSGDSGLAVVSASPESTALFASNVVSESEVHGVFSTGNQFVTVVGNQITTSGQTGINLPGTGGADVSDNVVRFSAQEAVRITGSGSATARGNRIEDSLGSAILFEADPGRSISLAIEDNELLRQVHGIFVRGCAGGSARRNVIQESSLDGILLRQCTEIDIVDNAVAASGQNGILVNSPQELIGKEFSVRRNRVVESGANGIAVYARGTVVATGNEVTTTGRRSPGLTVRTSGRAQVALSDNVVRRTASHGIFVEGSDRGLVQNSIVHTSGETGITLRSCPDTLVANNLIYGNQLDGLAIGTGGGASPRARVVNNTVYGNGGRGFVLGSGGVASGNSTMVNNIIEANGGVGMAIDRLSASGLVAGFNINSDGHSESTPVSPFDRLGPAGLLAPAGADQMLGGDADADDDFRLAQVRGGQDFDAPAVDGGSGTVTEIGIAGTTASTDVPDVDRIDVGFHYAGDRNQVVRVPAPYMPVFVRSDGDDGNDGFTPQTALGSIRRAALRAVSGATVVVGPGRYVEPEPVRLRDGAERVTFIADQDGTRTDDEPGPVVLDAAGGDTGFVILDGADVVIDGFHVTNSATAAIQIRSGADRAVVRNNVVFSNQRRGIEIRGADAGRVVNNLVYANGTGGVQLQATRGSEVSGNTVYGNGENGVTVGGSAVPLGRLDRPHAAGEEVLDLWLGSIEASRSVMGGAVVEIAESGERHRVVAGADSERGLLSIMIEPPLGMALPRDSSVIDQTLSATGSRVQRNVVAANSLGILVQANSLEGHACGGNVVADGLPGLTPRCDSDILADPELVDPDGADDELGGSGFADDDFRLWQDTSPAVDLTPCSAELDVPLGSTDPNGWPDECPIDSGYHYFAVDGIDLGRGR